MIIPTGTLRAMATQPARFLDHWQQTVWVDFSGRLSHHPDDEVFSTCTYEPLGLVLRLTCPCSGQKPRVAELEVDETRTEVLKDDDLNDPFFNPYWEKVATSTEYANAEHAKNITLSTCAEFLLNRRNAGTNTQSPENPMNTPAKRTTSKTKPTKNAILDGAKTAAASTVADRIRRLLTKRLANTPLQPIVDFIPNDVLNFLFAMAVSTVADYAPGVPKRDAVKTTAMLAVEGSSHDASRALLGFLADLFAEIIEDTKGVIGNLSEGK